MNDSGRTLNGETDFTLDSIDIIGSGIGIDGDFGSALQFIGKDTNNNLSYVNNPIENAAGNHLVFDSTNKKLNFDTDTDLTMDAKITVNDLLKATAGLDVPLTQSSSDHGLFRLFQGFLDIYHQAGDGAHIKKFFEVRVHNNISPNRFTIFKKDGVHPLFQVNCDDEGETPYIRIGASILFHEDNAYQLGNYNSRFQVIYSNNLIAGNTLIKLLEFDTHGDTFVFNPSTSTTDTMVSLNTIVQIGNPYLWRPMVSPNYKLDHTCFNIYVHKTNTDSIGQYSNTENLEREGASKNEIKLLNHLIPDGNINLGSIFNSYINIYSNSFTGNLVGNADTATKISTIDNDNIVLKDSVQTLTNKTITGSFTGDLTGNADTSTKISTIDNDNIVLKDTSQTLTNKAISGSFTGNLTGNADTATNISGITSANIVLKDSIQTLTNKAISGSFTGDITGDVTGNADTSTNAKNLSSDVSIFSGISINRSLHPDETDSWELGRTPQQGNNFASQLRFSAVHTIKLFATELQDDLNIYTHTLSNAGHISPGVNDTYDLGTGNTRWKNGWFNNVNIQDTLLIQANNVNFSNLPSSDPGVVGRLYVDNNFIKISDGN